MILPFSTQLNGKPTYFVEKIWETILQKGIEINLNDFIDIGRAALPKNYIIGTNAPKLHTIRRDEKNRWKPGTKIDFFINCRQKNMFRFAPVIPVVSTQRVFMTYEYNDLIKISVDGEELFGYSERLQFAKNDGFDTWEDFFEYFYPILIKNEHNAFRGKIIHWTDFRY